ncbi:hypothetical protein KIN20_000004 [Parelaphostrongylus tenuis]|uniref:Uncharacterized protein n=1 Tax=Parelaphostrongylus tenuis TaxID=148309 RepID=A0AAD5MK12_PARTN|nr:hypothetical protein KIN20_000004 [Parelaphostrongylus tenuis]
MRITFLIHQFSRFSINRFTKADSVCIEAPSIANFCPFYTLYCSLRITVLLSTFDFILHYVWAPRNIEWSRTTAVGRGRSCLRQMVQQTDLTNQFKSEEGWRGEFFSETDGSIDISWFDRHIASFSMSSYRSGMQGQFRKIDVLTALFSLSLFQSDKNTAKSAIVRDRREADE